MVKKCWWFIWLFTFAVVVSGAALAMASEADTLVIGIQDDTASLDPALLYEWTPMGIADLTYERLVNLKEDDMSDPIPWIAESWKVKEDGKTWLFHIRSGVSFASGNPLNADAVVFSLQRTVKLKGEPSWLLTQFGITEESITTVDEDTVQIVLDKQYSPNMFLACLVFPVASIIDPAVMEHERDGDMGSAWLEEHTAGSGPYILSGQTRGEEYTLTANENYRQDQSTLKKIVIKNVPESIDQAIMLERGEIDLAWDLNPAQIRRLELKPGIQTYEIPTLIVSYMRMNVTYEPFSKPEVRDAIRYAVDYEGLIDFVLSGAADPIQTFIPKGLIGYSSEMPYAYDPEKAKELLAQAGYADGFEVELTGPDESPWPEVALQLKNDLDRVGITATIHMMNSDDLWEMDSSRGGQLAMWDWLTDYTDPDCNAKAFAHADSAGDDAGIQLLAWYSHYVNKESSKLVEEAALEKDQATRAALYKQVAEIILDDGPFVFLFSPTRQYGVRLDKQDFIGTQSSARAYFPSLK